MKKHKLAIFTVLTALIAYAAIAEMTFKFKHPCLTDTERLLHIKDIYTFKQLDVCAKK